VLDHLTPTQRRALVIADNKIAENAGWDEELLALELSELQKLDFDIDLTGFHIDEIKLPQIDDNCRKDSVTKEIDVDEYEMQHKCPRCGFEFNDSRKA